MIKAVLFDLDGTLLPMDEEVFAEEYFRKLCGTMAPHGYDPKLLVKTLWEGTAAMAANDGSKTNEEAFWSVFDNTFGREKREKDMPYFDAFYLRDFEKVRNAAGFTEEAERVIRSLKEKGMRLILATNPIFPKAATTARIRWAGLSPDDFELVTVYENSRHAKPNPVYYRDILEQCGLKGEECLMIGNDLREDTAALREGISVFILTDCLIRHGMTMPPDLPHGSWPKMHAYLNEKIGTDAH